MYNPNMRWIPYTVEALNRLVENHFYRQPPSREWFNSIDLAAH
jgi:hypothetical protein